MKAVNWIRVLVVGTVAAACAPDPRPFADLPALSVSARFGVRNLCSLGVSPAIAISPIPEGIRAYTVRITNIDVLFQQPWTATVPVAPQGIAEGAASTYRAPCPGEFQSFRYRIEVLAQGPDEQPLAYGQTIANAVSLAALVRAERGAPLPGPLPGDSLTAPELLLGTDRRREFPGDPGLGEQQ